MLGEGYSLMHVPVAQHYELSPVISSLSFPNFWLMTCLVYYIKRMLFESWRFTDGEKELGV